MSSLPLSPLRSEDGDHLLDRPEPSNRLSTFPPEATIAFASDGNDETHVSDHFPSDGLVVIGTFYCLIDHRVEMQTLTREIRSSHVAVAILAGRPKSASDSYLQEVTYAKMVGGASEVFTLSRELAVLLGVNIPRDDRNRLRNRLILIHDGEIVWFSVTDPKKPDAPHDLAGLRAAIEDRLTPPDDAK